MPSSYSANAKAFEGSPNLAGSFPDGSSHTFAFAERYCLLPNTNNPEEDLVYNWGKVEPATFGIVG